MSASAVTLVLIGGLILGGFWVYYLWVDYQEFFRHETAEQKLLYLVFGIGVLAFFVGLALLPPHQRIRQTLPCYSERAG